MIVINKKRSNDKKEVVSNYLNFINKKDKIYNENYNLLFKNSNIIESTENYIKLWHEGQVNKVDKKPFHTHPISVAKIIAGYIPSDIELVQAGLSHDVIEDCINGEDKIKNNLGEEVLDLVKGVTEIDKSYSWDDRKSAYIEHLEEANTRVLILSLADHISNLHRIIGEYLELGEELWKLFGANKSKKINYFYLYANKVTEVLKNHESDINYSILNDIYNDYLEILDYFGNIIREELNIDIDFDYNLFVEEYNKIADLNGGYYYEVDDNNQYLIFDYVYSSSESISDFALQKYKSQQEY